MGIAFRSVLMSAKASGSKVVVTCDPAFAGKTISCTKSGTTLTQICPSTSPYTVTFEGLDAGVWTISATVEGQTFSTTAEVQDVSAVLNYGFVWTTWVDTAQFLDSTDYNSLDEVLEDEEAVRELMLEHACVDYMASFNSVTPNLEKIIENDLCAKWINLSDYALDFLEANTAIKALMDTADKYGYGEWVLMPQVPTMTSITAPYGELIYSDYYINGSLYYYPYYAFDGNKSDTDNRWISLTANAYIGYKFLTPTNVKRVSILSGIGGTGEVSRFYSLQYSDDGTTYYDAINSIEVPSYQNGEINVDVENNVGNHLYWRIKWLSGGNACAIQELQFYAWQPKGNVPVMTSNTAPYGTASASSEYDSTMAAWKAFDGDEATNWNTRVETNATLTYSFTNPICPKRVKIRPLYNAAGRVKNFKIQGSNDGTTFEDLTETLQCTNTSDNQYFDINTDNYYLYLRIAVTDAWGAYYIGIITAQFYGRELSVSVPTMTGNTTPYGEASASAVYSDRVAYKAFDGSLSDVGWNAPVVNNYVAYTFTNPVCVKRVDVIPGGASTGSRIRAFEIRGSNDNFSTYETLYTDEIPNEIGNPTIHTYTFDNNKYFKAYSLYVSSSWEDGGSSTASVGAKYLQFYGKDYSEKEFEEGTTKKWLYDHGVELETLEDVYSTTIYHESNQIFFDFMNAQSSSFTGCVTSNTIDLTSYNLMRVKLGNKLVNSSSRAGSFNVSNSKSSNDTIATSILTVTNTNNPNNLSLDISSVNQSVYCRIGDLNSQDRQITLTEWWLE